jgi:signal transduction histidine kinase/CheY-like chemotaxis protein
MIPAVLMFLVGIYSLYDSRKALKANIPLYLCSFGSMIWTVGMWLCYMQFSPWLSKLGLFVAEGVTSAALPIITSAMYQKSDASKLGKYGLIIQIILYLFFMIFHGLGYYVNVEIIHGALVMSSGDSPIYYAYILFNVLSPLLCIAILLEIAIKMRFKREWYFSLALIPLFVFGDYLLYIRFFVPDSRLFGCFVQTAIVVVLFFFTKQYNIRLIADTKAAEIVFATVRTPFLFASFQGNIFYANTGALGFFGLSLKEIRGKTLGDLFQFEGIAPGGFIRHRASAPVQDTYRTIARNNQALCHLTVMYQYDNFDELLCAVIEVSDVTEREQLISQLERERQNAEAAALAKSNFLANTSHEIRTPMNAILGMAELILRKDIAADVYEHALSIKQAGSNLLAIINDILDFSKIESGKLELVPSEYLFASEINDVISIIRMRIAEKPIIFIANIDSRLPNTMIGDKVRVRQVLLNILSNAAKYTKEGYILFTIAATEVSPQGDIMLTFKVSDTGIGIKPDDTEKLFGEFVQFDTHKNEGIEGTGLGLAISRNLCRLMGGDIAVESRYGEGSTFTVTIPQQVKNRAPIAQVEDPQTKKVLLYETRKGYAESLLYSLENLGVPVTLTTETSAFYQELRGGAYSFAFCPAARAEKTIALIKDQELPTLPVLLVDAGEIASFQNIPIITMPAYTVPIANILNDVITVDCREKVTVRFTAPTAKLLIVDDIVTNLQVAQGLLALYQTEIHTCTSGKEAIALVRERPYDVVFMDHMMPEMDGIETTAAIRGLDVDYARDMPIIALTANAISGMKEMFLAKGFNDYLAKPIEISKLDDIMEKWIPLDKRIKMRHDMKRDAHIRGPGLVIEGIDVRQGITMTGGTESGYRGVLSTYCRDAEDRLKTLDHFSVDERSNLAGFTTQVHALKSASASIGAAALSEEARLLEMAGKNGDMTFIRERTGDFCRHLEALVQQIRVALGGTTVPEDPGAAVGTAQRELFLQLQDALAGENIEDIDRLINTLEEGKLPLNLPEREALDQISQQVLMAEFKEAIETIKTLLNEEGV